ncbi:MAG TPA: hypothetical protein DCZ94_17725 [Lentisphaeria bacterium]|nr:MAG: hypothetical protein A2X48_00350 [Lentisphaerae bacterium GWF2_49_21]HBC88785.1 hypothetical protein [Lentisphaeria bacterium]
MDMTHIYTFVQAQDAGELAQAHRIRYQVYCEEKKWLEKADYPSCEEKDGYDPHSVVFLAFDPDGNAVGTARLIIKDDSISLPIGLNFKIGRRNFDRCCEISRMAVPRKLRRGNVAIGLIRMLTRYILDHRDELKHLYISVEERFLLALNLLGLEFVPAGPAAFCCGDVLVPTRLIISELESSLMRNNRSFYNWIMEDKHLLDSRGRNLLNVFTKNGGGAPGTKRSGSHRYARISLVNPPLDEGAEKCVDMGHWLPLNLMALSSYLVKNGYRGEIQILDQQVCGKEEMMERLACFKPDLVGISPNINSYRRTLEIAESMKRKGADIVLGGAYATRLAANILRNRECIDYVIAHDGERALHRLAEGMEVERIRNLVFRNSGNVHANGVEHHHAASHGEIDYSLFIDMEGYFRNYRDSLNPGQYARPATIMTHRGCVWREKSGGCVFCSRIEPFARFDPAHAVWDRLKTLKEDHNIDSFIDVGDDFTGDVSWLRRLHSFRPPDMKDMGIRFMYSRLNNLTPENISILKDLNTSEICLGLESGDPRVLGNSRKGHHPVQQIEAVRSLSEKGINIIAAFMVGLPGESRESLQNTLDQASRIMEFPNVNELIISVTTPLPGSKSFEMLMDRDESFRRKYGNADVMDVPEIQRRWMSGFCETDYDTVMEYADRMRNLSEKAFIEFC